MFRTKVKVQEKVTISKQWLPLKLFLKTRSHFEALVDLILALYITGHRLTEIHLPTSAFQMLALKARIHAWH